MEKITGIGGFFFRAKNPDQLNEWYEKHLGINNCPEDYESETWRQSEGPTVFGAEKESKSHGRPEQTWSINFRVRDLDAMVAQLSSAGIKVEVETTVYPNGRFAHLRDPEGNRIELWEPSGTDSDEQT